MGCLIIIVTLIFMTQNILILSQRGATAFTSSLEKSANKDVIFTQDDGFQLAYALVDFASEDGEDFNGKRIEDYVKINLT